MKPSVRNKLIEINNTFYEGISSEFDSTRQHAWEGWLQLLPFLWDVQQPFRIVDIGCGNGRFGTFLHDFGFDYEYTGIDFSKKLLKEVRKRIPQSKTVTSDITKQSFFDPHKKYDIICLFAVLHHIPDLSKRSALLEYCAKHLDKDGLLIFTAWQFLGIQSLVKRIIPWDESDLGLHFDELEVNDYLLDWQRGKHAIRYCHFIDLKEIKILLDSLQLTKVAQFYADGKEGKSNIYVVLRKS